MQYHCDALSSNKIARFVGFEVQFMDSTFTGYTFNHAIDNIYQLHIKNKCPLSTLVEDTLQASGIVHCIYYCICSNNLQLRPIKDLNYMHFRPIAPYSYL